MTPKTDAQSPELMTNRLCLRAPVPEIALAASYLNDAVSAHMSNRQERAEELLRCADMPEIRDWTESLWGKASPYVQRRIVANAPAMFGPAQREVKRILTSAEKHALHCRDGYHCRFCEIPVIRPRVRDRLRKLYPPAVRWGKTNSTRHAALQAMGAEYDHILPHSRGGNNDPDNLIVTCAPCNCARWYYTLEEVGLADPRLRNPIAAAWDGLERLLN